MAESAKKVAQQTEDRLENLAETVREKFDKVTEGTYRDRIIAGRFADQTATTPANGAEPRRNAEAGTDAVTARAGRDPRGVPARSPSGQRAGRA